MCGIVGYIGKRDVQEVLLSGLRRLEYRGYDSAGIALCDARGKVKSVRAVGEVKNLENKFRHSIPESVIGIAHTRWATHGKPSIKNAHPHTAGNIYLVHNGIVENYDELKRALVKKGCEFSSDTDSEVLAHLINLKYKEEKNLLNAVSNALRDVRGAYALVVMSFDEPGTLIAARLSSPLVLGVGDNEYILASDVAAVVPYTKRVIYLEDGDLVRVDKHSYSITTLDGRRLRKKEHNIEWGEEEARLQGYPHFMLKEIFEQPTSVREAMRGRISNKTGEVKLGGLDSVVDELSDIERIIIVSCGTSYNAGLVGEYMLEGFARIPTEVEYASEFRYRNSPIKRGTAVLAISQSGETADTLAAIKEAKRHGALTLGIVNTVASSVARETVAGVYNHAGPEIAVASTKAFTSQLTILSLFAAFMSEKKNMNSAGGKRMLADLVRVPKIMEEFLEDAGKIVRRIAKKYAKYDNMLYLGRKYQYPLAMEGALKIKETAYIHAEGYAAGEMKHGPIALVDKNVPSVVLAPKDSVYEKMLGATEELKARGGKVLAITTKDAQEVINIADDSIIIPKIHEALMPLVIALPLQLFAYHCAVATGRDVDKPRNLAKSVTVE